MIGKKYEMALFEYDDAVEIDRDRVSVLTSRNIKLIIVILTNFQIKFI